MTLLKKKVLYLPSTPLNILVAVAHASAFSEKQVSKMVLIDQKSLEDNVYFNALYNWQESPFETLDLTFGRAKGWHKMAERKQSFAKLSELVKVFNPDAIATGSDRRVEFQYAMHTSQSSNVAIEGWYLDDGLYSYAGRPYKYFKDVINSLLKKIGYGCWWQEPKTVGASKWIDQAWLFQPDFAVALLQAKQCQLIKPEWFVSNKVKQLSKAILSDFQVNESILRTLQNVGVFLLIPHPNNIKKMTGYEKRIFEFLTFLKQQEIPVAVKYHPRTRQVDPLKLVEEYNVLLLPSGLAFEFILPFLKKQSHVIGDVGTALLTAKWLRPDLKVTAVLAEEDAFQIKFKRIYEPLGLNMVAAFKDIKGF
ncbi:hypothetical protein THMIRHAM_17330 [Thiomicrorhabdus immobilis]|uniref:Uncharacterized protein n=1 Tax=Thiomicrorhabdus immobilis TaxID=2791037 RepID=A0ABM7MET5_9GAMM|nr:alpha-2,8-polysialyltransferase family protein [Thiomicrorhabdus immobilis]BCN93948.1 hypothetical protein THMIRHAM_17330 [Thiomicrorhabdus immobilis]